MFYYKIMLNKEWTKQINHVVVTHLIEKGSNRYKLKSRGLGREMEIITDKELVVGQPIILGQYKDGELKCKVVKKEVFTLKETVDSVKISGLISYSYVKTSDNKEYCPIDIKTNKILEPERLNFWIKENLGIDPQKIVVQGVPKDIISPKITIYNQFLLTVEGPVVNKENFEKMQTNSIGKKKTYGLGWMEIVG